jgi:hypothetical protein
MKRTIAETKDWPGGPSNVLPAENELPTLFSFINNEAIKLESLELELKRLQEVYFNLESQRNDLSRVIEAHRGYISPIRRIPDDIVREIMVRCLPSDPAPSHTNRHMAPMLLTHICRRWRSIAYSTPRLWSSLCVSFRGLRDDSFSGKSISSLAVIWEEDTNTMRWWLAMAGGCSLQLSFRNSPEYYSREFRISPEDHTPNKATICVDQFLDFLLKTSHRWASIDLIPACEGHSLPVRFVAKAFSQNLPLIKFIKIKLKVIYREWVNILESNALLSPKLEQLTLRLSLGSFSKFTDFPAKPWSRLTSLTLIFKSGHDIDDGIQTLYICEALERVVLLFPEAIWSNHSNRREWNKIRKSFPRLHTIELNLPPEHIQKALCMMSAPLLEDLSILATNAYGIRADFFAEDLGEFFKQSSLVGSRQLRTLKLDPLNFTESTFDDILGMFPAISRLVSGTQGSCLFGPSCSHAANLQHCRLKSRHRQFSLELPSRRALYLNLIVRIVNIEERHRTAHLTMQVPKLFEYELVDCLELRRSGILIFLK